MDNFTYYFNMYDKVSIMSDKQLLEDIRHELTFLTGLKAFDSLGENIDNGRFSTVVENKDLIELNYVELIKRIDKELEE